jgi:hypothetical protein
VADLPSAPTDHCHNHPSVNPQANSPLAKPPSRPRFSRRESAGVRLGVALQESPGRLLDAVWRRYPTPGQTALGGASEQWPSGTAGWSAARRLRIIVEGTHDVTVPVRGVAHPAASYSLIAPMSFLSGPLPAGQSAPARDDFRPGIKCACASAAGKAGRAPALSGYKSASRELNGGSKACLRSPSARSA